METYRFSPPKKNQQTKSLGKVMMIIFFNHKGVSFQHDLPPKIIVIVEYYVPVLKTLLQHILRKHHELVENSITVDIWAFHNDIARPNAAISV